MKCAIRFNVSSTIIILFQFQKKSKKLKKKLKISKMVNFTKKVYGTKKNVKYYFTQVMFHKISCIFNHIIFMIGSFNTPKYGNIAKNHRRTVVKMMQPIFLDVSH